VLESLGYREVSTYLNSGNALVTSADDDPVAVAGAVGSGLARALDLQVGVLAVTPSDLSAVIAANPFPEAARTPKLLHVTFLSDAPAVDALAGVDLARCAPDEFRLIGRAVYLRFAVSSGRSRMPALVGQHLARTAPGVVATARNWKTVLALAEKVGA
jgi:uncharacterized protein (DUF1697 family)